MRIIFLGVHCIAVAIIMFALMMLSFALADLWRAQAAASPALQSPKPASVQTGWPKRRIKC